jgi:hypothetical protein
LIFKRAQSAGVMNFGINPVEKLWKYVKDNTIKNKVFEVLSDLEDEVCQFLFELEIDVVKSICGVVY